MAVPWSPRVSPGGGPGVLSSRAPALVRVPAPPHPRRHLLLSDCRPPARRLRWVLRAVVRVPPTSSAAPQASGDSPGSGRPASAPLPSLAERHLGGPGSAKRNLPHLTERCTFWSPSAMLPEGTIHGEPASLDPLTPSRRPNAQRSGRLGGFTLTFFICVFKKQLN